MGGASAGRPLRTAVETPGVGVNSPGGWFANAANADDVGSINTEGVNDGVKRKGSARGVGSRS